MPPPLPYWIIVSTALLTPLVAIIATTIAYFQWSTAEKKRKIDLFDKRYELYKRLEDVVFKASTLEYINPEIDRLVFIRTIDELPFVFGKDIQEFRTRLLKNFIHMITEIDSVSPDHKKYASAKEEIAKIYVDLAPKFWSKMNIG